MICALLFNSINKWQHRYIEDAIERRIVFYLFLRLTVAVENLENINFCSLKYDVFFK